jgi:hypothetical protein
MTEPTRHASAFMTPQASHASCHGPCSARIAGLARLVEIEQRCAA